MGTLTKIKFWWLLQLLVWVHVVLCKEKSVDGEAQWNNATVEQQTQESSRMWSNLLEDYVLSKTTRMPKVMPTQNRYIPTSGFVITKRIGEAMELEPHLRPPGKLLPQMNNPNFQMNNPNFPTRPNYGVNQPLREVSETDLYLLGAIEKLVYRVDYLENRVRRSEQLIYYLMAGNNQKEKEVFDPCPTNFTRIGDNCYHISADRVNWKTGNTFCKSLGANLAEFESISENEEIVAFLLNHPGHRGKDFWLGGLNPGLLWIWSNSAKPVNPNTNLTFVANSVNEPNVTSKMDLPNENENKIVNNASEIKGNGRCLRLTYNPAKHSYFFFGQECTSRHHFICEHADKTLENKIKKTARELNLI